MLGRKERRRTVTRPRAGQPQTLLSTEAAFLLRQAQLAEQTEQLVPRSAQPPLLEEEPGESRSERLRMNKELEAAERRVRQLTQEMGRSSRRSPTRGSLQFAVALRKDHSAELERVAAAHADELRSLQQRHAEELAQLIPPPLLDGASETDNASSANSELQQLRRHAGELDSELRRVKASFAEERRDLKVNWSTKLLVQERAHRAEVQELKDKLAAAEDETVSLSDQLQAAKLSASSQSVAQQQLEESRKEDHVAIEKLRAELRALQLSTAVAYKDQVRPDELLGARLSEAHSEARTRQLQNQLDFLKAQLTSEQQTAAEQHQVIADLRLAADSMREETRVVVEEKDRILAAAVEEAERRVEIRFNDQLQELSGLRTKVGLLQSQLQDAQVEITLGRQREEANRSAGLKVQSQLAVARAEAERLAAQVQELRLHREMPVGETKQSQEAALRRLDNEKQYLKSQLTSEITLKNELQSALTHCQHQLADVTAQWHREADDLRQSFESDIRGADEREAKLRQSLELVHTQNEQLVSQIAELRCALSKLRDQMRMDQFAAEGMKDANRRLLSEVDSLKDEIALRAAADAESIGRHTEQLEETRASAECLRKEHAEEISRIRAVVGRLQSQVYALNLDIDKAREDTAKERSQQLRYRGSAAIFGALSKVRRTRIAKAFRTWGCNTLLIDAAAQFRNKVSELMATTLANAEEEKTVACRGIQEALNEEKEEALRQLRDYFEAILLQREAHYSEANVKELRLLEERLVAEAAVIKAELESRHQLELRQLSDAAQRAEVAYQETLRQVRDEGERTLNIVREELALKAEEAVRNAVALVERDWEAKMLVKEAEFSEALKMALSRNDIQWAEREKGIRLVHDEELRQQRDRMQTEAKMAMEHLNIAFQAAVTERNSEWEQVVVRREAEVTEEYESRLETVRREAAEMQIRALSDLKEQLMDEAYDSLVAKEREWRGKLENQELALSKSFEAELKRALDLEAAKWQVTMRDADSAREAEMLQARKLGWDEGHQQALQESGQLLKQAEEATAALVKNHSQLVAALNEKHQNEILSERRLAEDRIQKLVEQAQLLEEKTRLTEEAHVELQEYIRAKEVDMAALRIEVSAMRRSFETVSEAVANKDKRIRMYAKRLQDEVAKERAAGEIAVAEARIGAEQQASAIWTDKMAAREAELKAEHEARVMLERKGLEDSLRAATATHEEATRKLKDEVAAKVRSTLVEIERRKNEELQSALDCLRVENARELDRERKLHQDQLSVFRRTMDEQAEGRIRELRELWEDEAFDAKKALEWEAAERLELLLRGAANEAERERIHSVELEASKWQKLLSESESKLEIAVQMARAAGWDARDKQAKEEIDALKRQLVEISCRSESVDTSLEQLAKQHAMEIDEMAKAMRSEFEERIRIDLEAERRRMEELFSQRMQAADESHEAKAALLKERLAEGEKTLNDARSDFSQQLSRLAQERSDLLETINQRESQIAQLREAHSSEKEDLRQEAENDRMLREIQQQRLHKVAIQELQSKYENAIEEAEAKWDRIADNRVKAEVAAVSAEKEAFIAGLKSQFSAELIKAENSLTNLKAENGKLESDLKEISGKLEEAEDRLYDEQQKVVEVTRTGAFSLWSAVINAMRLKSRLESTISQKVEEMTTAMSRTAAESSSKLSQSSFAMLKLAGLMHAADNSRLTTQRTLTQHKADVLVERKSKVKLYEKELVRMGNDRKALEAERAGVEQDIQQLTQQVADLEDQIHEHNRFSAMQNGRINVPHVRKKRRLDNELEKLLELIEIKRGMLADVDSKILLKDQERSEKELSLVEMERDLVNVLIEQQRLALKIAEEDRKLVEAAERILDEAGLPWPPPANVTLENALTFFRSG